MFNQLCKVGFIFVHACTLKLHKNVNNFIQNITAVI